MLRPALQTGKVEVLEVPGWSMGVGDEEGIFSYEPYLCLSFTYTLHGYPVRVGKGLCSRTKLGDMDLGGN